MKPSRVRHPAVVALTSGHLVRGIDPFELFCAYHLGLTAAGAYKFQNVHDVARRFHVEPTDIEDALRAYGLDTERLLSSSFDTASAQVDIQVSPPGVDLVGLAQMHWEALLDSQENARDWKRELADDEAENARTFGAAERNDDEA